MPFERLKFERISKFLNIQIPHIEIPPPIVIPPPPVWVPNPDITYRGVIIMQTGLETYEFTFNGLRFIFKTKDEAIQEINILIDSTPPPPPPPPPPTKAYYLQVHLESPISNIPALVDYNIGIGLNLTESEIRAVKAANPDMKLYAYYNVQSVYLNSAEYCEYLDKDAILMNCIDIPTEVIRDLTLDFVQTRIMNTTYALKQKGYDGIFTDNFPTPTVPSEYRIGLQAYNSFPYTKEEWLNAQLKIQGMIPFETISNGIPQADGVYGYYANKAACDRIIQDCDGLMIEGAIGWSHADLVSRSTLKKQQNANFIKQLYDTGKPVLVSNTGSSDMENEADTREVIKFYLANAPRSNYTLKFRGRSFMEGSLFQNLLKTLSA